MLAASLPKEEFDVHVCALTRAGPRQEELAAADIPYKVIGKRWKVDPIAFHLLRRYIARLRPDLVHTWLFSGNAYGRAAALAVGVKYIVASERCVDGWKSSYQFYIDRLLARWTDRIVVNSGGIRDFCVSRGLPVKKFVLIPGGVPSPQTPIMIRDQFLERLQLPPNVLLIGAVGRLWPQKRVKDLIWAADLVHLLHENARLLVIGDGPLRRQLERFTSLLNAEGHILFLGERSDVSQILPHVDVFWQGSQYEGLPNAIMEAMAAKVPVVASDIPGNRDLVVSGETGFLVPVGNRAARVRATDRILKDRCLARQLGNAGQRRVLQQFNVGNMIEGHTNLYRDLLQGSARQSRPGDSNDVRS